MVSAKDYLKNPCGAASIPYWKLAHVTLPKDMQIVHGADFREELLQGYVDEPYFRLIHHLSVAPVAAPAGYSLCRPPVEDFASHISECYACNMTTDEVRSFTQRAVYCPELWLALRNDKTGQIVATGIGELDRQIGEGILEWIQVSPAYRGRGLGSYVVKQLLWRMKDMADFATVSGQCNNPFAPERLYRGCGFTGGDVWHILRRKSQT